MNQKYFSRLKNRPEKSKRLFRSERIEQVIADIAECIVDSEIQQMFSQCLPNTLDTAVTYTEDKRGKPDTFISTGDIPALWLRDSANQIAPYLRFIDHDEALRKMIAGLVRRQTACVLTDPYANAFAHKANSRMSKNPWWSKGVKWKQGVWERKFELDSLASFLWLSAKYWECSGDTSPFDARWIKAIARILDVFDQERETLSKDNAKEMFRFFAPNGKSFPSVRLDGYGYPGRKCGLVRSVFRPSDDEAVFPYSIPANAFAVVALQAVAVVLRALPVAQEVLAERCERTAREIDESIKRNGIVIHRDFGDIFAYEIDGFGSQCLMDDPNVPSLLSLPFLGYCASDDPVYLSTRKFILGVSNPFFVQGKFSGVSSPHTGALERFWPMATIVQALTTDDEEEIRRCLFVLKETHAGTHFIHESVDVNDPHRFTRPWFGWANSLFGELILTLAEKHPDVLEQPFP